jgi:hypothetical protein
VGVTRDKGLKKSELELPGRLEGAIDVGVSRGKGLKKSELEWPERLEGARICGSIVWQGIEAIRAGVAGAAWRS